MSKEKKTHIERTAKEPRDPSLHALRIAAVTEVSPSIRLFRLALPPNDGITFRPGQWVDLYPPPSTNILKPGGFTITSSPSLAQPQPSSSSSEPASKAREESGPSHPTTSSPHIELAIQASPSNPPAAYLFQSPPSRLLDTPVQVRIGGSFVFPPPSSSPSSPASLSPLRKVVFVASGMGINPLMSMLSWIGEQQQQQQKQQRQLDGTRQAHGGGGSGGERLELEEVRMLYGVRDPGEGREQQILFLDRVVDVFKTSGVRGGVELFLTGERAGDRKKDVIRCGAGVDVPVHRRRITVKDVEEAVGKGHKDSTAVYICGVPTMTDEFVEALVSPGGFGMEKGRVLFEKWW
ncbi:hypothetical protein VTK26DRAFT_6600 [Humicola hyalothermophila]